METRHPAGGVEGGKAFPVTLLAKTRGKAAARAASDPLPGVCHLVMNTNLLDPSSTPALAAESGSSLTAPQGLRAGIAPAAGGVEPFADLLARARQDLAGEVLALQTHVLGPTLALVTPSANQPDTDSLAAFARAQGLDPQVVAWLFDSAAVPAGAAATEAGTPPASVSPVAMQLPAGLAAMPPSGPAALIAQALAGLQSPGTDVPGLSGTATLPGTPPPASGAPGLRAFPGLPVEAADPVPADGAQADPSLAASGLGLAQPQVGPADGGARPPPGAARDVPPHRSGEANAIPPATTGTASQDELVAADTAGPADGPDAAPAASRSGAAIAAAAAPMRLPTPATTAVNGGPAAPAVAPTSLPPAAVAAIAVPAPPPAGAVTLAAGAVGWAVQAADSAASDTPPDPESDTQADRPPQPPLQAQWLIRTQALAGAGAARQATAAQAQAAPQAITPMPVEELALEIEPELEALWRGTAGTPSAPTGAGTPGPAAEQAPRAAVQPTGLAPQAPGVDQQERADTYEALAQRLGEAVARRMLGQIQKGHWQVRLMLKPATLGDIEVELRMRSGELDASFRAANPATRELLADSLPRLREVMANAGMDIAKTTIGDGQTSRNGENPTPRQSRRGPSEGPAVNAAEVTATSEPGRIDRRGLDVMV